MMHMYKSMLAGMALTSAAGLAQAATIQNAGFENGWEGWTEKDPAAISGVAYSGSNSLKIGGNPGRVHQVVSVKPNTEYTLSAYVNGKGQIGINDLNGLFKNKKFDVGSWTKVSRTFTTASTNSLQVFAKHNNNSSDVRFDNFSLVETGGTTTPPSSGGTKVPASIAQGTIFDLEGSSPNPLVDDYTLVFLPLEARYTSPNGNGWRHEYKIKSSLRVAMTDTYEEFSARVKVEMSDAGKTIIAQHHASDTGTIMKVYVSDSRESGFFDSVAGNGVFDVYVRLRNTSGNEEKYALGTIRSGDSFDLKVLNNYGEVYVTALGRSFGIPVEDDSESYFKFGNYLQSQDTYTLENCGESGNSGSFADCFDDLGITKSKITMTDVSYIRVTN
ncbi:polysaccharide lyase family 7 protein [Microbulbifer sp. ARAS458-1]|uniref:polysaccharide lyase family 7 protein n=1 Tax=Microbulbifer sp. ARAS458-1 TaxID=3140242 RepID=UPI003877ED7E